MNKTDSKVLKSSAGGAVTGAVAGLVKGGSITAIFII